MEFKPYNYQQYCINRIVNDERVGLFLDMGLGKTVVTLSAIKELKYNRFQVYKTLVIAPKKVAEGTWSREADKWEHTKMLKVVKVMGTTAKRVQALHVEGDIYVINRDNVVWLTDYLKNDWCFDMIVIDESSSFKNHQAKRFKALSRVIPKVKRVVELTGTPSPNGLLDLWSQVYLLDQGERLEKRFTQYRDRYFMPDKRGASGMIYSWRLRFGSQDAIMEKISDICVSMKAEDYLELPELIEDDIIVELDERARLKYDTLEKQFVLELPEDEEDISALSAASLSNKLLQLSNGAVYDEDRGVHEVHSCKLEAFVELIDRLQGKPALVFYEFIHDKDRIKQALAKKKLTVKELKTDSDIDDWNHGHINVLLAHPSSAAYGLNLQEGGNHIIWFGLTWNYEQYVQANKRLHRQGQKEKVIIHHLVCEGTRDEDVAKALASKDNVQSEVLESLKARIRQVRGNV